MPTGWQLVLRSKNIYGPYEEKIALAQGKTATNGPHQGALVDTPSGEWWFLHFQDRGAYGRIVHLQPAVWKNGFPVIGADPDGDGTGEPVMRFKKPNVGKTYPVETPADSDEFEGNTLGRQWQWQANPQAAWGFPYPPKGVLRMYSVQNPDGYKNLWDLPNLLLQKFPAEEFTATAKVTLAPRFEGEKFGLVVMGLDYSYIGVAAREGRFHFVRSTAKDADKGTAETEELSLRVVDTIIQPRDKDLKFLPGEMVFYLRVKVAKNAVCTFSFSTDAKAFTTLGPPGFKAREGRWIGAKIGFFFTRPGKFNDAGSADIDWFRFEK